LLFLWSRLDKIVVVDIDGTITHTFSKRTLYSDLIQ
jgi:phosphatidate phosphatase PAH1